MQGIQAPKPVPARLIWGGQIPSKPQSTIFHDITNKSTKSWIREGATG